MGIELRYYVTTIKANCFYCVMFTRLGKWRVLRFRGTIFNWIMKRWWVYFHSIRVFQINCSSFFKPDCYIFKRFNGPTELTKMYIFYIYIFFFQIFIRIFVPGTEHICNFATVRGLHRQSTILHGTFDTRKTNALTSVPIVLFIGMQPLYCLCLICPLFPWIVQHWPTLDSLPVFCPRIFWGYSCQWRHFRFVTCRFLMVFLCLLLSIFSTIRELQEVSSLVLYYLVSKSVVNIVHGGMNFTPIVHCFTNLSDPWRTLIYCLLLWETMKSLYIFED